MNASIAVEAVKAASIPTIATPITSLISGATAKPTSVVTEASVATAEASTVAAAESTTAAASMVAESEKFILGISQRNFVVGASVIGGTVLIGGGLLAYRHFKGIPKNGIRIILKDTSNVPGMQCGNADYRKLDRKSKKDAKALASAVEGLEGAALMEDLVKYASAEKPELVGVPMDCFPSSNVKFTSVEDRVAMGAMLVYQAQFRAKGYPTILEYDSTGDRPTITIYPVVKGKPITTLTVMDIMGEGKKSDQK